MSTRFLQFLQEGNGSYSSSRLAYLGSLGMTLYIGAWNCFVHRAMMPLDPTWVALVTVTMAGKAIQYGKESADPPKP